MAVDRGQTITVNGVQTNASISVGWNDTSFTGTLTSLVIGPANLGSSSNISAIEVDGVILKNLILPKGPPRPSTFNPFNTDINTVRGQETGYATWNPLRIGGTVTLSDGEQLEFDKLVLATGAVPRTLPSTEGLANVFVLRQPDDATAIRATARVANSAVIIGGGYIGLEVAASLRKLGLEVSVVEMANRLLARVASPPVAELLNDLHVEHGVSVYTGVGVNKILNSDGKFTGVTLADGSSLNGDMLIVGIGVIPDSKLAQQAGVETERDDGGAILVNSLMQTSNPDIIAMGDVALQRGHDLRIESVHNAQDTAARAAASIMCQSPPRDQAPWFWSDQYDANLQSVGIVPTGDDEIYQVRRIGENKRSVSFWSYRGKDLIAIEAVRDSKNFMLGKKCLENNFSPDPKRISDPNYDPSLEMG